jgi:hypothetical protein
MTGENVPDEPTIETVPALRKPAKSVEDLHARYLSAVAARIWETCCWPDRMADGWKIGDFRFVVFSVSPDAETDLYVQLWSEPREQVLMEVCSGEWSPGSIRYVLEPQRRFLRSLGYEKGGKAKNFARLVDVRNAREAEDVAREALRIFFDAFGYRGQWPLEIRCERGERAEQRPVFAAITSEDLAKLLTDQNYTAIVPDVDDTELVLLKRGRRRFTARLDGRLPGENVYRAVILDKTLPRPRKLTDANVAALGNEIAGLSVRVHEGGDLRLSMLMLLDGGVTEEWMLRFVDYYLACVRRAERLVRQLGQGSAEHRSVRAATVH